MPMPTDTGLASRRVVSGFVISEFTQPPHRRLPWHEHQHASFCYVVSGHYAERTRGREEECAPRAMVFKPAGERHADVFGEAGGRCLLVEIRPQRLDALGSAGAVTRMPSQARSARLATLGHGLYREFRERDDASALALEGGILEVLAETSRTREGTGQPAWLKRARDLIHDRADQPITLSKVAREVGVHPAHLARTFRRFYHRSLGAYLRGLRIDRASRALAERTASIAEVALRAGFYDQSHFTRVFKRHTGMTPAQFKASFS